VLSLTICNRSPRPLIPNKCAELLNSIRSLPDWLTLAPYWDWGEQAPGDCSTEGSLHHSITSVTTPEPTVLPPSRMANLVPVSRAIGLSRLTSSVVWSPGITS
jgi:hypothetical protein